jgi:nucleoside-diphosphate-sugar epimerase
MTDLPVEDLDSIVHCLGDSWPLLRGADILVTGGTGFFGVWLVSALLRANERLGLGLRVHVMSRKPEQYLERAPGFRGSPGLQLVAADVRNFRPTAGQRMTHVVHAATAASAALNASNPVEMANVAAEGTHHILAVARDMGVERMLFTSSGAVYGKNPPEVTHVHEDQMGMLDPLPVGNAYAEGKRLAELYCASYVELHQLAVVVARCFAFVGPYLPLDTHFAIGNFMRDALRGRTIIVNGDGTPRRSYLYITDLVSWLLRLLLSGTPGRAYNVGSDRDISIGDLAVLVGAQRGVPVEIRGKRDPNRPTESYVPSTERIRRELGVAELVGLEQGVHRSMTWYAGQAAPRAP